MQLTAADVTAMEAKGNNADRLGSLITVDKVAFFDTASGKSNVCIVMIQSERNFYYENRY